MASEFLKWERLMVRLVNRKTRWSTENRESAQVGPDENALSFLDREVRKLRDEVSGSRHKDAVPSDSAEMNYKYRDHYYRTPTDEVRVADLLLMKGELNGEFVKVIQDDECNTNVVSFDFVREHHEMFRIKYNSVTERNAKKQSVEDASESILELTVIIRTLTYLSNWAVEICRYDVLLGMPWHICNDPTTD